MSKMTVLFLHSFSLEIICLYFYFENLSMWVPDECVPLELQFVSLCFHSFSFSSWATVTFEKTKEKDRVAGTSYLPHIYSIWHTGHSLPKDIIRFVSECPAAFSGLCGFCLWRQVLRLWMPGCSQSLEWSTLASYATGTWELPDRVRLKIHPAKSLVSNCGQ